jgi:glycosyltransferase involved in cell wall biosynthesis
MNTEISVIIPVYNGSAFVKNAYRELKAQQLADAELIFVDNNSTDDTLTLLLELKEADTCVCVLQEQKKGAAAARNRGIREATGEFVYFFDVDDQLMPGALLHLLQILKGHPEADSVFGRGTRERNLNQKQLKNNIVAYPKPYWGLFWFSNFSKLTGTPSFLHRKRVFDTVGVFPETLRLGEDAAFHIKLGLHCNLLHTGKVIFYYHRHEASTVTQNNKKQPRVYTYWQQYVSFYIDYYLHTYPDKQFGNLLHQKMALSMLRMIRMEKGVKQRIKKYKELKETIRPLKINGFVQVFFTILTFFPLALYAKVVARVVKLTYPDAKNLNNL